MLSSFGFVLLAFETSFLSFAPSVSTEANLLDFLKYH